ncbi:serine acetyltransferase [Cryobacterium sp. MDB1-18-2]|nr:serine acetyltransferase [Cryobacterium sp. MDB1-18-2]TFC46461.1 serine acetyltransferase [Cryobacterium sp. MDB1-18-1]
MKNYGRTVSTTPGFRFSWVFQDFAANAHRPRTRLLLVTFRLAQAARHPFSDRPSLLSYFVTAWYVFISEWVLGMELPVKTHVGSALQIVHGFGLVINVDSRLGSDVVIRQGVTIGNKGDGGASPTVGDGVSIGSGACVIGAVTIGARVRIGANAVVVTDVPEDVSVVGNPGRILQNRAPGV